MNKHTETENQEQLFNDEASRIVVIRRKERRDKFIRNLTITLGVLAVGTGIYNKVKKRKMKAAEKTEELGTGISNMLYKDGLCTFIDLGNGHLVSTIEATNFDEYTELSEEALGYFKTIFNK